MSMTILIVRVQRFTLPFLNGMLPANLAFQMGTKKDIVVHDVSAIEEAHYRAIRDRLAGAKEACAASRLLFHELGSASSKALKIQWDEKTRIFTVRYKGGLPGRGKKAEEFVRSFPVEIADRSTCRCGSSLQL